MPDSFMRFPVLKTSLYVKGVVLTSDHRHCRYCFYLRPRTINVAPVFDWDVGKCIILGG